MNIETLNTEFPSLYVKRDTSVFSITIAIPGGAMAEEEGQYGYAHLLEHMLFRGTRTYATSKDLAMEIEGVGGRYNGFTTYDAIYLTATVPANYWQNAVKVLFSLAYEPLLEETALSTEKQVVISEIQMAQDQPEERAYSHLQKTMWNGHRLGEDVIGRRKDIENATKTKLYSFWEKLIYQKPCVAMAGPIDGKVLESFLRNVDIPSPLEDPIKHMERPEFTPGSSRIKEDTQQTYYRLALQACEAARDDIFVYQLISNILGGSSFSQLFLRIREEEGLSYSVYSTVEATSVAGALIVSCDLKPKGLDRTKSIIQEELERLSQAKLTVDELDRFKRFTVGAYTMSLESTSSISLLLADRFVTRNRIWDPQSEIQYINSISVDLISENLKHSMEAGSAEVILGP